MNFVSLADASRGLGIDAKTLRRWLADAQLPLQNHPRDGRKKGISSEHLDQLARSHQRRLAEVNEPPPLLSAQPPLPAVLLALPQTLGALQAQIAALQQQVAELVSLLQPQLLRSERLLSPTPQKDTARRASRFLPTASASAKTPPKPAHVIPRVEYDPQGRYVVICPKRGLLSFEPDTPEWFAWVTQQDSFRFVGKGGHFTAHHEWRVPRGAWRAHRKIRNHTHIVRLAPNQQLTLAVLEQAAQALQALLT